MSVSDSFTNSGTISSYSLSMSVSSSFTNTSNGMITADGSGSGQIYSSLHFDNEGTIAVTNGDTLGLSTYGNGSTNNGIISVESSGRLIFGGVLAGTGSMVINDGGTLEVSYSNLSDGVSFAGIGTLQVDGFGLVSGALSELTTGDALDFPHAVVTNVSVNNNILTVTFAGGDVPGPTAKNFTLATALPTGDYFLPQLDGQGGTDVVVTPLTLPAVSSIDVFGTGIANGVGDLDAGRVITFTVNFSGAVSVNTAGGTPTLNLNNGAAASYSSGSGTSALAFTYTVASGQNITGPTVNALSLNGGIIPADVSGAHATFAGLQIDTTPPATPAAPSDSAVINGYVNAANDTSGQVLTGTAEDGSTVTVYDNNTQIGTTKADASTGAWSLPIGVLADASAHSYTVTATDAAGNVSQPSDPLAFTVDTTMPTVAVSIDKTIVNAVDPTAQVTFTFSKPPVDFSLNDVTSTDGTLSNLSGSGTTYTATFTAAPGIDDNAATVSVMNGSYHDAAGNAGTGASAMSPVQFSSAVATFYEIENNWAPSQMIDGIFTGPNGGINGWSVFNSATQTSAGADALLTLASPLPAGEHNLTFTIYQNYYGNPGHILGDFALDYTTAVSPTLSSTQTPVSIQNASSLNGTTFSLLSPGELLANTSQNSIGTDTYTISASIDSPAPITGIFLDAIKNPSLPGGGPGGKYGNGNFVVSEFTLDAGTAASTVAFTVDTIVPTPAAPSDSAVVNGYVNAANDTAAQALTGTAEDDSTVTIYDNGTQVGTTTADASTGAWSFPIGVLADGSTHSYTVTAAGAADNVSQPSPALSFAVDTTAPATTGAPSDSAVENGYVNAGNDTAAQALTGSAEDGSTVTIYDNGTQVVTTTANASTGAWSSPIGALADASTHSYTVTATDAAGNVSQPSAALSFTVDITPPATPATPADSAVVNGYVNAAHDTTAQALTGSAEDGSTVRIYDNGTQVGTTTANASTGAWSFPIGALADASTHSYTVTATDAAGNLSQPSAALSFVVDATAPATPTAPSDSAVVNGYVNAAHDTAAQALTGTAEDGSTVTIYDNRTQVGTTSANASTGAWSFPIGKLADASTHSYTVTATDAAGNVSQPSAALSFVVDTTAPAAPAAPADSEVVNGYVNAALDTAAQALTGNAEDGSTVTIYDHGTQVSSTTANASTGAWSFPIGALADASTHSYTVAATDAAGNVSQPSAALSFTVDITPPATPATPADSAVVNGYVNAAHDTTAQALTGSAEDGSTVTIYDNGTQVGTTTANASTGAWSFPIGKLADASTHSYTVTATDAAGNVSQPSAALNFVVDTDAGEQGLLKLTVTTTAISAATAASVPFTIAGLDSEDTGTVTFTDVNHKTVVVNVNGNQNSYTANLSSLADGTVTSSLAVSADPAGNTFTPVAGTSVTLTQFDHWTKTSGGKSPLRIPLTVCS
jgi:large repetitive protein